MNADKRSGRKTQKAITCRSWIHQDRRLGIMTDQASFNDGGSPVDNQCELPTILSLQALDGLSAPESCIQAVPETAEAGAPMNRDLRNCCDPYLNHASLSQLAARRRQMRRHCEDWLCLLPGDSRRAHASSFLIMPYILEILALFCHFSTLMGPPVRRCGLRPCGLCRF